MNDGGTDNRRLRESLENLIARRSFLRLAAAGAAAAVVPRVWGALDSAQRNDVKLPPLQAKSDPDVSEPTASLPPNERVGFAIVGLGHISLDQMLPAFSQSKYARPTALVSGDRGKAQHIAAQYGIPEQAIYDYKNFDRLRDNPAVHATYIALPNGLHAEFTVRSAQAGKHVLCEKPMAVSVTEAEEMIAACASAQVRLMLAYRSQYEPLDRALLRLRRSGALGRPLHFVSSNSQNEGDPRQWRLNRRLAGGGPLPDVGIYCLNAARFLTEEEPSEVSAQVEHLADERFREVESSVQFLLRFPSGFAASCNASYDSHRSQFLRLEGSDGWAELSPAFAYTGLQLRHGHTVRGVEEVTQIDVEQRNQFALELDHMAMCILERRAPYTGGEEGLQDMKIMAAIYQSAELGRRISLSPPPGPTRGPEPA